MSEKVLSKTPKPVKLTIFRDKITGNYYSYDLHKIVSMPHLYGEVSSKDITVIDVESLVTELQRRIDGLSKKPVPRPYRQNDYRTGWLDGVYVGKKELKEILSKLVTKETKKDE